MDQDRELGVQVRAILDRVDGLTELLARVLLRLDRVEHRLLSVQGQLDEL
jgi:hypothetical protein